MNQRQTSRLTAPESDKHHGEGWRRMRDASSSCVYLSHVFVSTASGLSGSLVLIHCQENKVRVNQRQTQAAQYVCGSNGLRQGRIKQFKERRIILLNVLC